jgi:hypothetical protein
MITFFVQDPFPCVNIRQPVTNKETRDLSPIEVAIDDILSRNQAMREELALVGIKPSQHNNLMMLVQGTVRPQVNAGAAEVARVFLTKGAPRLVSGPPDPSWDEMIAELEAAGISQEMFTRMQNKLKVGTLHSLFRLYIRYVLPFTSAPAV